MRPRHTVLIVLWLLLGPFVLAQSDGTDDFIRSEMKRQNIPGLSLVVVKDGKIVKAAGYGLADRQLNVAVTPDTVFKIGSVSKQFIATGIMLLVQEGRLRIEDPVGKYLQGTPAAWTPITIRHLLTHTSGLVREAPGFDPFKIQTDAEVISSSYSQPLHSAPGDKWEYSNLGYYALAEVIRVVTQRPWSEYLEEKVFIPAGMLDTRTTTTTEAVPRRAKGYTDNDSPRDAADWPAVRPSGAFLSTVLDLAKWDAVLYTSRVLGEPTRRQMWTPVTLNDGTSSPYGFGWHLGSADGHRAVFHGGGLPGFIASFARYVDDRVTIAILMNTDDADDSVVAQGVAKLHLPASAPAAGR